jgi:hypothetical protein
MSFTPVSSPVEARSCRQSAETGFAKRLENLLLRLRVYMAALQDYPCRLQMAQFG